MLYQIAEQFEGELTGYHPYATVTEREKWEALDPEWKSQSILLGEKYLGHEWAYMSATDFMDFTRTGNRSRFETRFFSKRKALGALVLAECVENKGRFLDDIINGIYAICDENAWNLPAHNYKDQNGGFSPLPDLTDPVIDLFACETGAVIATALYLLEPVLDGVSPLIAKRMRYELDRRVLKPYLEGWFSWMGNGIDPVNNWSPWCTQNVLLTAFLSGCYKERHKDILQKACRTADYFLAEYGDDGCCDEGAQYYHAAGLCLSAIIRLCDAVTKGAFAKLYQEPKIRNMADYIYKVHVDDIYYVNFADCSPVAGRAGSREYLFAKDTQNKAMMDFAAEDYKKGMPDTLLLPEENNLFYRLLNGFTAAEIKAYQSDTPAIYPDVYYPSVGLMVVRDGKLLLAAKAGDNADSHNHNDVGSFTVYRDGKPLAIDVGVETYSRKTFSPQRYEIWTMQSSYHNLPEINGYMQQPGKEYRAKEVSCDLAACSLDMELSGAYPEECGIAFYRRNARLDKGKEIVVTDSFAWKDGSAGKKEILLSLMTYDKPVLEEAADSRRIFFETGAKGQILLENAHVLSVEEIPISDTRLSIAWKHEVYRIRIAPEKESFTMRIC